MGTAVEKPNKIQIAIWGGLVLLMLVVSLSNYQSYQLGTHFDDARYLILARSLIASPNYGMINAPGTPAPGKYPFGYPFLLVPFLKVFPGNLGILQVSSLLATLLIMIVLFWGWRWLYPDKSHWWGLAVTGLYALAPLTIDHTRRVMSEPFFTLFCLITILLANQYVLKRRATWGWRIAFSFALVFTIYTRTIGFLLFGVVIIYLFIKTGIAFWKEMARILVLMSAIIGLVIALTPVHFHDLFPVEYLRDENARFIISIFTNNQPKNAAASTDPENPLLAPPDPATNPGARSTTLNTLFYYGLKQHFGSDLRVVVIPLGTGQDEQRFANQIGFPAFPVVLGLLISFLIALGLVMLLRRRLDNLFLWFALIYFFVIFFWTWNDPRLLYPIQAQLIFAFVVGLETAIVALAGGFRQRSIRPALRTGIGVVIVLLLFSISLFKSLQIQDSRIHAGDLRVRTSWLESHSSPGSIVLSEAPEIDYIYGGRKTLAYPSTSSASQLQDWLLAHHVDYVLVAPDIQWQDTYQPVYSAETKQILPLLEELSGGKSLTQVYSGPGDGIEVFQVRSGS